jgi:hypothetical protein
MIAVVLAGEFSLKSRIKRKTTSVLVTRTSSHLILGGKDMDCDPDRRECQKNLQNLFSPSAKRRSNNSIPSAFISYHIAIDNERQYLYKVLLQGNKNMSAKAVREYHGKKLIANHVKKVSEGKHVIDDRSVLITPDTDLESLPLNEPWLTTTQLVVKPDQLIKRRGKAGLVGIKLGTCLFVFSNRRGTAPGLLCSH